MKRTLLKIPRVFDDPTTADDYADRHAKMVKKIGKAFAKRLSNMGFKNGRILDAGSGGGEMAIEIAMAFPEAEVVGIDLSEPLVERSQHLAEQKGLSGRVIFQKADVGQMPFEDDSFDAVVSLDMLHIVEDPVTMLNEMERVLKPDGELISQNVRRSWIGILEPIVKSAYTPSEVKDLITQSNLRPCKYDKSFMWLNFFVEESKNLD